MPGSTRGGTKGLRPARGDYAEEPEFTATFEQARRRLGKRVYARIVARVRTFAKEWREVHNDGELRSWHLATYRSGSLEGCKVRYFRHVEPPGAVHYRVAYCQVPEPFPRLVFIEAYLREDEGAALGRIRNFVKRRGYC